MAKIDNKKLSKKITDKYSIVNEAFCMSEIKNAELDKYDGKPKDEINVIVGDDKQTDKVYPQVKLERWSNEVNFSIRLVDNEKGEEKVSTKDDKILWEKGNIIIENYPYIDDEGGYKFVWYLKEKPKVNKFDFTIQSKGLDFFYQPELTQKEKDEGAFRPENVIGSYAVYHSTKGGMNDKDSKDYKTGKAFHIYRPHLYDSNGLEAWGKLHIENGIYSVEIPQEFLDKAVYPIKSNDTFGYTTVGRSTVAKNANYIHTSSITYTPAFNGTGVSMSFRCWKNTGTAVKMALYNSTALIENGTTGEASVPDAENWTSANFTGSPTVSSSIEYYLAFNFNGTNWLRYDSTGTIYIKYKLSSYGTWPDPISWLTSGTYKEKHSIYATYTASASGTDVDDERDATLHGQADTNSARSAEIIGSQDVNTERDGELHGQAGVNSDRGAEVAGKATQSDSRGAETSGIDTDSDSRSAETSGVDTTSDERASEVIGIDSDVDNRNAEIHGELSDTDTRDAEITGVLGSNDSRDSEIHGVDTDNDSRVAEIHGSESDNDSRGAEIHGIENINDTRDAEIHGQSSDNDSRDSEIYGKDLINSDRDAEIYGEDIISDSKNAEIHGQDTDQDSRDAEIVGREFADSNREAEISGIDTSESNREAEVTGKIDVDDSRDAELNGIETLSSSRSAEILVEGSDYSQRMSEVHGIDTDSDNRDAEITGSAEVDSERDAEVIGKDFENDSRGAEISGEVSVDDNRGAEISGTLESSDTRNAEIIGKEKIESERGAEISGKISITNSRNAEIDGSDTSSSDRGAEINGMGIDPYCDKKTGIYTDKNSPFSKKGNVYTPYVDKGCN